MIVWDMVSGGRQAVVRFAGWLAGQQQSLDNARRASTEVSRRRVERDAVTIYLDSLRDEADAADIAADAPKTRTAQSAD